MHYLCIQRNIKSVWRRPANLLAAFLFAGLVVSACMSAKAVSVVPFYDDFESYTNNTPLIDGIHNGWYGTPAFSNIIAQGAGVTVVSNSASAPAGSTNFVEIPVDCSLSNNFDTGYTINHTNVWVEMFIQPATLEEIAENPVCDSDVAASFYVNTNGHFVVRDGGNWVALTGTVFGAEYDVGSDWVRVNCRMDYSAQRWWIFMDGVLLRDDINFANTINSLSALDVYNGGSATSYLDNVNIYFDTPPVITNLVDLHVNATSIYRSVREGNDAASALFEVWNDAVKADGTYFGMLHSNMVVNYSGGYSGWLSLNPVSGTVYGERAPIDVTFSTAGLPASTTPYTAVIRVEGEDEKFGLPAQNSPREIMVELWVRSQPVLTVDPLELQAEANFGGQAPSAELRVSNTADEPRDAMGYNIAVSTETGGNWLSVTPVSGVSTGEIDTLAVNYDSRNLAGGIYTGNVSVTSAGAVNDPVNVPVYLRINQQPVPAWDLDVMDPGLSAEVEEGASVEDRHFHVWNASAAPVARMRYEVNLSDDLRAWVSSVTPAVGVSSGEAHRLTVKYAAEDMPAGIYGGTLTVRGIDYLTGEQAGELSTNLTLRVVGRAALNVDTNRIYAQVLENLSTTGEFRLWNSSGEPRREMRYQISTASSWLQFNPVEGVVQDGTATVSVVFNGGTLAQGDYVGEVIVDAWDTQDGLRALGAPLILPARLVVGSRTPVNYEPPEIIGLPRIGQFLEATPGLWNDMDRLRFEYQWERADNEDGARNAVVRSWASDSEYRVRTADRGKLLRVVVRATDPDPVPLSATAASSYRRGVVRAMPGDFDGDGRSDLWFFNPADANWHASLSAGGSGRVLFGSPGMTPVPGDYNGDGYLDLGLYDRTSGMWHVMLLPSWEYASGQFGWTDTVAVPGDYNGNGATDLGVYWEEGGRWYIYYVGEWRMQEISFGGPGMQAVPGDYDGDGITDLAVYSSATGLWQIRGSRVGEWSAYLGGPGALPAIGDYDGDGKKDVTVYWPASNLWQMRLSSTGKLREERFGVSNGYGIPMTGYYDRDRFSDPAHAHIAGDFIIWSVRYTTQTNYFSYMGQSYQISTDFWRVVW